MWRLVAKLALGGTSRERAAKVTFRCSGFIDPGDSFHLCGPKVYCPLAISP